jgi:hypothetical protein
MKNLKMPLPTIALLLLFISKGTLVFLLCKQQQKDHYTLLPRPIVFYISLLESKFRESEFRENELFFNVW